MVRQTVFSGTITIGRGTTAVRFCGRERDWVQLQIQQEKVGIDSQGWGVVVSGCNIVKRTHQWL